MADTKQRTILVTDAVWDELTARAGKAGSKNAVLVDLLFRPAGEVLDSTAEDGPNQIANPDMSYSQDAYGDGRALGVVEAASGLLDVSLNEVVSDMASEAVRELTIESVED